MANITISNTLSSYIKKVKAIPKLSHEEETMMFHSYHQGDVLAFKKIVQANMYISVAIALNYRQYGLPIMDLISEGHMGIMKAVKGFKASKGFRFATYASWWVLDAIQSFILKSWSIVSLSGSTNKKRLFFSLSKVKNQIKSYNRLSLQEKIKNISHYSSCSEKEVEELMDLKNVNTIEESNLNCVVSENPERLYLSNESNALLKHKITSALHDLNEKEVMVLKKRIYHDNDKNVKLKELANEIGVSAERVRQISNTALKKIEKHLQDINQYE